ncbi:uncharacterized protein LOC133179274 [Saccostrea echinata]|uniref:uncharacterized protein LOC133179274 n=1 Tax=Saccostrea echinata TaxID=191078 RepID=UPI002A833E33|nr:uncharacterized protein LOC133179274 [Saccostrea echinata]
MKLLPRNLPSTNQADVRGTSDIVLNDQKTMRTQLIYLQPNFTIELDPVNLWIETRSKLCNGNFIGYRNLFAHLKHVQLNPRRSFGRKGGETLEKVIGQPEKYEYLSLEKGYFKISCQGRRILYDFNKKDHLKLWLSVVKATTDNGIIPPLNNNFTIAVTRYEYVNLYHVMTDWFNAFLMLLIFKKEPETTSILLIDSHPVGGLDSVWTTLFGHVTRAGHMTEITTYKDLVWSITGYNSLLNQHALPHVPYLEEFREFFLSRYNVKDTKKLNCENLSILFIWRKDYVSHPRNPKGKIKRKIRNEMELQRAVQQVFPYHNVKGVQIDSLPMSEQLHLIANTDILVGMHGAGLSFTILLPRHASLIELFPRYLSTKNNHFRAMAKWRNLYYLRWQNRNPQNEFPNYFTYIPIDVIVDKVNQTVNYKCEKWMRT